VVEELRAVRLLAGAGVGRLARAAHRLPRGQGELVQPVVPGGVHGPRVAAGLALGEARPVEPGRRAGARRLRADRDDPGHRLALDLLRQDLLDLPGPALAVLARHVRPLDDLDAVAALPHDLLAPRRHRGAVLAD